MIFEKMFALMAEKQASDLFVTAGAPIHIKVEGVSVPINQQIMVPAMIQKMAYEMMTAEQIERFERDREINLSFGRHDLGNFRINAFWQRNSVALVVRFIQGVIPTAESLGLPAILNELVLDKRGLVLVVGATGSGKSTTLASMIDYRIRNRTGHVLTVEDPIEFLFRHNKSIVNQREIGIDTHSWHNALRNAMRQAPDC
ncbi:MAG: Flp pilus assembly complex ATPase component TadA, partial [Azoarcus sp.]|nr:Flp pilus assembly complex ATPase component TadA [Azoarcus sp.]